MAVMAAASGMAVGSMPSTAGITRADCKPARRVVSLGRTMKGFAGMKPESRVNRLGLCESTEKHFARAVLAQARSAASGSRGGAAASTCNIASEIFRVVPIMSGLVLTGIALGFVLLRIEAAIEESE